MAFGISKGKTTPIAIDFGADSLKMLQVLPGDPTQIIAAKSVLVPEEARQDAAARVAFYENAVREALRDLPFRGRRATCAIPAYQMLLHNFTTPRCEQDDLNGMVNLAMKERLGLEPARMMTRNFHGCDHQRGGTPQTDIISLSCPREQVMQYMQLTGRCKLEVVGMHPEPTATLQALAPEQKADAVTQLVVDLGSATTKVMICGGVQMLLARTVHAAGATRLKSLMRRRGLTLADARRERVALLQGQPVLAGGGVEAEPAGHAEADLFAEDLLAQTLLDELRATVRHHRVRHPGLPIQRLVFCGGESADTRLIEALAGAFGLSHRVAAPLEGMTHEAADCDTLDPLEEGSAAWTVAAGLTMSDDNL